jgi:hypothetical protein
VKKPSREVDTCKGFGKRLAGPPGARRLSSKTVREILKSEMPGLGENYNLVSRRRSALPTTLTEDSAIAAAAMIGDSNRPKAG